MQCIRGPLAALMCFSLLYSPEAAQAASTGASEPATTPSHGASRQPYRSPGIEGDQRIVHALNRLTFGPRPGDVEAVRTLGLERWFDQQLHPAKIDEADLDARLAAYPAMQRSPEDLLHRLPSNAIIRQAIDGKIAVPGSGVVHAIYENQMYRVAEKKQEKQDKAQPATTGSVANDGDDATLKMMDALDGGRTMREAPATKAAVTTKPGAMAADMD